MAKETRNGTPSRAIVQDMNIDPSLKFRIE